MKRLKRWFIAFLVGEFLTLFKKDESFKKGVVEKTWSEKIQHIFDGLLHFNKELVKDTQGFFDTQALETHLQQWVTRVEQEYKQLLAQIEPLKKSSTAITHEFLEDIYLRFDAFSHTALLIKDKITAFDVEKKIQERKKILETVAKKVQKQ